MDKDTIQAHTNTTSPSPFNKQLEIKKAAEFLKPETTWRNFKNKRKEIYSLAKTFQGNSTFSYARRLFQLLYNGIDDGLDNDLEGIVDRQKPSLDVIERLAVCTYKDTDLSSDTKYNAAVTLLKNNLVRFEGSIYKANIKGLLGSIYKKKWQYENNESYLYDSLHYYKEGYKIAELGLGKMSPEEEGLAVSFLGFCGINKAYVFDLLANLNKQRRGNLELSSSNDFEDEASKSREELITLYKKYETPYKADWKVIKEEQTSGYSELKKYWFFITLAEAHIGTGDFKSAKEYYELSLDYGFHPEWAKHAASVQGFNLLELRYKKDKTKMKDGRSAIRVLLGKENGIPKIHSEKIGLALSGGGFRASLFHIGVLAQLAEKNILHKVEAISCVSGGSIIGALYYLKLGELLQDKSDINSSDYVQLVKELEEEFTSEVKKNIRLKLFSHFGKNSKMAFRPKFTRTSRIAELYNKHFYDNIFKGKSDLLMRDLKIYPARPGDSGDYCDLNFNPIHDNWKLKNKIPALIINATTLNTGHCWQFTASWMGESPSYINSEFDALPTLRRMYYHEAGSHENILLSTAVAASTGVPGAFAPVELENLYNDHEKVLLVDGGVHDNQGLSALYEEECNVLIISDASGQMPEEDTPSDSPLGVILRSNAILQNRIRDVQFKDLESRKRSGLIQDYLLIHFTKDLYGKIIDWTGCDNRFMPPNSQENTKDNPMTKYQIDKKIQQALAKIRTDLDSFHDSESFGLMYSGYKITEKEIEDSTSKVFQDSINSQTALNSEYKWGFIKIEAALKDKAGFDKLENTLNQSFSSIGKWFLLKLGKKNINTLRNLFLFTTIILTGIILFYLSHTTLLLILVVTIALYFLNFLIPKNPITPKNIFTGLLLFILGIAVWVLFNILRCFNKLYISAGELPDE